MTKFSNRNEIVSRECFRHLASVIQRRPGSDHSCFVIPSSFVIHRRKTCSRGIEHVHGTTIVRFTEHRSKLVLGKRYLAVHDGSLRCLFYPQCSTGKFRSL